MAVLVIYATFLSFESCFSQTRECIILIAQSKVRWTSDHGGQHSAVIFHGRPRTCDKEDRSSTVPEDVQLSTHDWHRAVSLV